MVRVAAFAIKTMIGIIEANWRRIFRPIARARPLTSRNLANSLRCASSSRTRAAPTMFSFSTLFRASTAAWTSPNSLRTRARTTKKVRAMMGTTSSTARANRQLIQSSRALAPRIRNSDEISDARAVATNILMASTSEVKLVSKVAGVRASMAA